MAAILIVDDDDAFRASLAETLLDEGHTALEAASGEAALALLRASRADAAVIDIRMRGLDGLETLARLRVEHPALPVAILTAVPDSANTIEAMRLGAIDHLAKPLGRAAFVALVARLVEAGRDRAAPGAAAMPAGGPADALIGRSAAMREVQKRIGQLADGEESVLVTGETGTGKEVVARLIHRHGRRSRRPFVAVNCAAIPPGLLESELFGHVRGSFTGAVADRRGAFRDAAGGTLFLDEIGDMPPDCQGKLLRVVQERVVTPVGGKPEPVDVRIVSATHRNLAREAEAGRFREDLFYRLSVVPLSLPPLRERPEDIEALASSFLPVGRSLSLDAIERLERHAWRGNVRELQNAVRRAASLGTVGPLRAADFAFLATLADPAATGSALPQDWLVLTLPEASARLERLLIDHALARAGGNRSEAARALGIHRQLLHAKIGRFASSAFRTTDVRQPDDPDENDDLEH